MTMLANYAETRDGLLAIQGGGWDTITVNAPVEGAPDNVFAIFQGYFVARIAFHRTETDRDHRLEIVMVDADGAEVMKGESTAPVGRRDDIPESWAQNVSVVVPLTGVPLPHAGTYRISLLVNGEHKTDVPFRVVKGYED